MLLCICSVIDHMWCQNVVRKNKWHIRCSLACSSCQLLKWSKIANGATVPEEWKREGDSALLTIVLSFLSVSLMFLAHFDVLCDLQLYIAMVTWNQFVLFNKETKIVKVDITYVFVNSAMDYKYMRKPIKMHVEISLL